ncbi:MAG: phenylalanine--tRNA ligase subunit beta [Helicobacteraceae bacterium]|jgi:phenylalanyl-tRNA synthetase beta chain|nr:phenylalanine--tRNA ligase subunit beta [Helicobacteraceae bacterium]
MIVTRSWLNEWIKLDDISTDDLAKTFNSIGLEVDRIEPFEIPEKIVFGKVTACERHPDADKLNVCQVDLGSTVRQIVCGAANVREGIIVAVATLGAEMPGGLTIKPIQLRGVDSEGMICSSTEIGLPKLEDGIMVIDESVGEVKLGEEIRHNPYFNDDLIEIELTANRGDCLSIRGIARDLCAAFNRPLKKMKREDNDQTRLGIGRFLQLMQEDSLDVDLTFRALDLKGLELPLIIRLRLAQIEETKESAIEGLMWYATHSTGVVLRGYHYGFFNNDEKQKAICTLKRDEKGFASIYNSEKASTIGIYQEDASRVSYDEGVMFLEASYIPPEIISRQMAENKIENGPHFYRTSRGSEPELEIGLEYVLNLFESYSDSSIYGGSVDVSSKFNEKVIGISVTEINAIIGMDIKKATISKLLKGLGFELSKSKGDNFVVEVPRYRHDIVNKQDVVEEIVRLVGIDNIESKASEFKEAYRVDEDYAEYTKRKVYRHRAAQSGFYETVHFVFNERTLLEKYGFATLHTSKELLNPIAGTLDTLRSTLMLGLVQAASHNVKVGQKSVKLFESGSVFDAERSESVKFAFMSSGSSERDKISNGGKPSNVDFASFVQKIADVIGDFLLRETTPVHSFAHPYQVASVIQNEKVIGELFKLHPSIAEEYDLEETYLCEVEFASLEYAVTAAKSYSKYQASFRDLSVVMPSSMNYAEVEKVIEANRSAEMIRFYPVDRYSDEKLGDNISLSLRFVLQSEDKTLEEEDITSAMSSVLNALEKELGLTLR